MYAKIRKQGLKHQKMSIVRLLEITGIIPLDFQLPEKKLRFFFFLIKHHLLTKFLKEEIERNLSLPVTGGSLRMKSVQEISLFSYLGVYIQCLYYL